MYRQFCVVFDNFVLCFTKLTCVSKILCCVSITLCCVSKILCCVSRIVCCVCRYEPPYLCHFHDMFVTKSLCFHLRFEGGGCEECSLLAEALSIALQVGEVSIIKRPIFFFMCSSEFEQSFWKAT